MRECTTEAIEFPAESSKDVLTEILREGAQKMLGTAIEAEVEAYIAQHANRGTPRVIAWWFATGTRLSEPFRRGSAR